MKLTFIVKIEEPAGAQKAHTAAFSCKAIAFIMLQLIYTPAMEGVSSAFADHGTPPLFTPIIVIDIGIVLYVAMCMQSAQ